MPNWCSNLLYVSGNLEELGLLDERMNGANFTLQKCKAMPKVLIKYSSHPVILSSKKVKAAERELLISKLKGQDDQSGLPMTRHTRKKLIKLYGSTGWYSWRLMNWGTKWDVNDNVTWTQRPRSFVYEFETAWGPPIEAIVWLSKDFPKLNFTLGYNEPGMAYKGIVKIKDGKYKEKKEKE